MAGIVFYIARDLAAQPIEGACIVNRWWTVHPEKGLAFYTTHKRPFGMEPGEQDEPSPQCNGNEYTARVIQQHIYPDCGTEFVSLVFMGHAVKEMHAQRKAASEAKALA